MYIADYVVGKVNLLFIAQIIPDVSNLYEPLEACFHHIFIAVTWQSPPEELKRSFLALPGRL